MQKRDPRYQAHQKQQMKDWGEPGSTADQFVQALCHWKENIEKNQRDRAEKDRRKADEDSVGRSCSPKTPISLKYGGMYLRYNSRYIPPYLRDIGVSCSNRRTLPRKKIAHVLELFPACGDARRPRRRKSARRLQDRPRRHETFRRATADVAS